MHLYMDDSGTRHPDRDRGRIPAHGHDWFGLGGVLIRQEDEEEIRECHAEFCRRWEITAPLRSADIRNRSGGFAWLGREDKPRQEAFYEDLYQLMAALPLVGVGCVIDRPGYNRRYKERYAGSRWLLCKTAFSVAVERAAKYARRERYKLRVYVERGDKKTDRYVKSYYEALRTEGMPFEDDTSGMYAPLSAQELQHTLYDFRTKRKSSPIMQLADLYLWPICIGGYDANNRPYARLKEDGKLIDCLLSPEEIPVLGIKYSCWELVDERAAQKS